jgi:hypothetical protein
VNARIAGVEIPEAGDPGILPALGRASTYNQDPGHLRDLLLYRLTLEAQKCIATTTLPKREIVRRLGTSPSQLYRLVDQTNYRKSVDQMLRLLQVLNCDVEFVVRRKSA